ncbi:MAG: hypothetical protein JJ858_13550 [Rhizobiaceae bacterium]|nr:hypothetical protein [Rhizobiaceae bacterium]
MFQRLILAITMIFVANTFSLKAYSAQVYETGVGLTNVSQCSMMIEGIVQKGDAAKVEEIIQAATRSNANFEDSNKAYKLDNDLQYVVCFSSAGGNYLEGIRLAKLFAKHFITTSVPDRATCLSACAIAFLGGHGYDRQNKKSVPNRYVFPGSKIGFHAPSLSVPEQNYTEVAVSKAYKIAMNAIFELRKHAEELSIPQRLLIDIISHRGDDFFMINTLDQAELAFIRLTGYRQRKIQKDTFIAACWNSYKWYAIGPIVEDEYFFGMVPVDDDDWKGIFNARKGVGNRFLQRGRVYEFQPFDGEMDCSIRASRDQRKNYIYNVALSQNGGDPFKDPDPNLKGAFRSTILMRGSRTLESTR